MGGVTSIPVWLNGFWAIPLCSDWVRPCWLMGALWELKQPSSVSDWTVVDSGVSASGGRETSPGDGRSYSSLDTDWSVPSACEQRIEHQTGLIHTGLFTLTINDSLGRKADDEEERGKKEPHSSVIPRFKAKIQSCIISVWIHTPHPS